MIIFNFFQNLLSQILKFYLRDIPVTDFLVLAKAGEPSFYCLLGLPLLFQTLRTFSIEISHMPFNLSIK